MTNLETAMRRAHASNPRAFREALAGLGLLAEDGSIAKPSRFRRELKKRFPDSTSLMRAIGMDAAMLTGAPPEERSRSIMDDEGAEQFAAHGHGLDDEDGGMSWDDWQEMARGKMADLGMSEDDMNELFEMLPSRQSTIGEKVQRTTRDEESDKVAERHAEREDGQATRQRRLESAEREVAAPHRRDDAEARRREHRNSEQSEDELPSRGRANGNLPRNHINRMAGDADLDFVDQHLAREPAVYVGSSTRSWRIEERANAEVAAARRQRKAPALAHDAKRDDERLRELFGDHFASIGIAY